MNMSLWCTRIIKWAFYLLFILVPLILTPINYELFEYNKMMVTYALVVIITGAWVIKMIKDGEIKIAKTPLDIPIGLFVASQLVSTIFSMDPHVSWLGYYSRFNGGMWSMITYVVLYYAFVSNFGIFASLAAPIQASGKKHKPVLSPLPPRSALPAFLKVMLSTAVVVSIYAVLERLGIDKKIWVQDVQTRVFSTLGQPNWLAAYLVALTPIAMAFALQTQMSKLKGQTNIKAQRSNHLDFGFDLSFGFWIWNFITILFFTVLLFTRSRSGLLGFAVADILFWILMLMTNLKQRKVLLAPLVICHVVFGIIIFFNGSNVAQIDSFTFGSLRDRFSHKNAAQQVSKPSTSAGPALETGGTESGTIRKYVWQAAVTAWKSSTKALLIGTGTETFAFAFYRYRPAGHNLTSEWDFLYNKAHNEYLNYLTTTGAIGLGTYLIFLGVFIVWYIKMLNDKHQTHLPISEQSDSGQIINKQENNSSFSIGHLALDIALFSGWISILITNFFGFSVVIMQIFLFLFPAIIIVLSTQLTSWNKKLSNLNKPIGMLIITLLVIVLLGILVTRWLADTLYAKSYQQARSGQYATAKTLIDEAIILNPNEPVYHDERATTLAALAVGALEQQQATIGGRFAQDAITENDRALRISPENVNFWKTQTKIDYSLSMYDPRYVQAAIEALTRAQILSPNDPKILYNLAILYGRITENDKAVEFLNQSIDIKSNYRDSYYALYVFYTELKKPTEARAILKKYLTTIDASDKQFNDLLGKTAQ
jgi:putative inorganic carbon (hco3(-)) transporter